MLQRSALPHSTGGLTAPTRRSWPPGAGVQRLRQLALPIDRANFSWLLAVLLLFMVGASVHVWSAMQMTDTKLDLLALQAQHTDLERESAEVMWQISRHTNLPAVADRAAKLGLRNDFSTGYAYVEPAGTLAVLAAPRPGDQGSSAATASYPPSPSPEGQAAELSTPLYDQLDALRIRAGSAVRNLWGMIGAYSEWTLHQLASRGSGRNIANSVR